MPTLNTNDLSLLDIAKRMDPNGSASAIAELLSQDNEVLDDITWVEGNLPTGHRCTVRTGLPAVAWRKLNGGVPRGKSRTAQITEAVGMLEAFGQIDVDLANLNGNTAAFRLQENQGFVQALQQEMAATLFYGDISTAPEEILGFSPRFNDTTAVNGENIIKCDGVGSDNASVWLIGWSPNTVHGIYPKGSTAGLYHEDLGKRPVLDGNGDTFMAYQDHYQWKCGIAMRDWRYVVRIANIDISNLTKDAATGTDLIDKMTIALEQIYSLSGVRPAFYVNRTIKSFLRRQIVNKTASGTLTMEMVAGKEVVTFGGVPVRRTDALNNAEGLVA